MRSAEARCRSRQLTLFAGGGGGGGACHYSRHQRAPIKSGSLVPAPRQASLAKTAPSRPIEGAGGSHRGTSHAKGLHPNRKATLRRAGTGPARAAPEPNRVAENSGRARHPPSWLTVRPARRGVPCCCFCLRDGRPPARLSFTGAPFAAAAVAFEWGCRVSLAELSQH